MAHHMRGSSSRNIGQRCVFNLFLEEIDASMDPAMDLKVAAVLAAVWLLQLVGLVSGGEVTYDGRALIVNGTRRLLFSGSIHYPRSTPEVRSSV